MTDAEDRANELVRLYILDAYRTEERGHLAECPDLTVEDADAYDSTYGCDTGCDYVRLEATLTCPHGEQKRYEYGQFGDLASIIEEMEQQNA